MYSIKQREKVMDVVYPLSSFFYFFFPGRQSDLLNCYSHNPLVAALCISCATGLLLTASQQALNWD